MRHVLFFISPCVSLPSSNFKPHRLRFSLIYSKPTRLFQLSNNSRILFFPLKTKSMFMQTLQSCANSLLAHGMWLTRTIRGSMTITNYRIFCCGCSPQALSSTFDFSRVVPVVGAPLSLESWHQPQRQGHTLGGGIPTFSVNWFLWLRCFVTIQCRAWKKTTGFSDSTHVGFEAPAFPPCPSFPLVECEIYLQYIADFFHVPTPPSWSHHRPVPFCVSVCNSALSFV